jgi:hypothetical protein
LLLIGTMENISFADLVASETVLIRLIEIISLLINDSTSNLDILLQFAWRTTDVKVINDSHFIAKSAACYLTIIVTP